MNSRLYPFWIAFPNPRLARDWASQTIIRKIPAREIMMEKPDFINDPVTGGRELTLGQ